MNSSQVELKVDWCSYEAAKYAVEHWHYSHSMPTPPVVKLGVWENGNFVGAILFSRGVTDNLGKPYGFIATEVAELSRVALREHISTVSKLISIAIRKLKAKEKGLCLLVSFADPNVGHLGRIYQAANWFFAGVTPKSKKFRDSRGRVWHSRQVSKSGYNIQYGEYRRCPRIEDCEVIEERGKYRYILPLNRKVRKQVEPLAKPYPKRTAESSNPEPTGCGGATPTRSLHLQAAEV